MLSIFLIVLPVFALIAVGWLARRADVLGANAARELSRFVVYLALPALLFDIVAKARWSQIWQPGFVGAYAGGMSAVFLLTIVLRIRRGLGDATIDGLNSAYSNTAFIGFPLVTSVFGTAALTPVLIATILTVCMLFAVSLVLLEIAIQTETGAERRALPMFAKVAGALARNPLVIAPVCGAVFLALGIGVPGPLERFLTLLGGAASPCALVSLGLFIAERREGEPPPLATVISLVSTKLLVHPLATWLLATFVFHLSAAATAMAVLIAALPTGTGPFMLAELYRREALLTARVMLISTTVSLITITAYLTAI